MTAVRVEDKEGATRAATDAIDHAKAVLESVRRIAESCKDPILQKKMFESCDRFEKSLPELVKGTKVRRAKRCSGYTSEI